MFNHKLPKLKRNKYLHIVFSNKFNLKEKLVKNKEEREKSSCYYEP